MRKPQVNESVQASLRGLPAVDELLRSEAVARAGAGLAAPLVADAVRQALADVRTRLLNGEEIVDVLDTSEAKPAPVPSGDADKGGYSALEFAAVQYIEALCRSMLTRVVNATGVVLHTNLGRAPLSANALQAVQAVAEGYSNLEYDVASGRRGSRDIHGETLLTRLTGAEAALIVNNNAAAVLLVLSALAGGREVVLSRGELIEIGGSFRIPEVMEQSGCTLREVGTTNRTHLRDYEAALGDNTAAILKVHPSNYRVVGFTSGVDARTLAPVARRHGVPLIEDLGSGVLVATQEYGLAPEPTVQNSIAAGVDVVTFSGDKLLGGPQAGIIVGRRDFVELCRRHPLARALRVDKMTLAALQATLSDYLQGNADRIPIYEMLSVSCATLRQRAEAVCVAVKEWLRSVGAAASPLSGGGCPSDSGPDVDAGFVADRSPQVGSAPDAHPVGRPQSLRRPDAASGAVKLRVVDTVSTVGGGSLPGETLPSVAIAVRCPGVGPDTIAARLRHHWPPVVGRIEADAVLLDLRTVAPADDELLAGALADVMGLTGSLNDSSRSLNDAGRSSGAVCSSDAPSTRDAVSDSYADSPCATEATPCTS